jgi:hypothetical protein
VGISATCGHEWSTSHTFKTEYSHPVAPRSIGEIDGAAPVIRDTGDFKVTAGNTTWLLHDVYFDTPDPDAGPAYRYTQKPIGP